MVAETLEQKYFQLAARLGDPDAQQELAFCLANGKGCKKDRKEAAKWYRAAVSFLCTLHPPMETHGLIRVCRLPKASVMLVWRGYTRRSFNERRHRSLRILRYPDHLCQSCIPCLYHVATEYSMLVLILRLDDEDPQELKNSAFYVLASAALESDE